MKYCNSKNLKSEFWPNLKNQTKPQNRGFNSLKFLTLRFDGFTVRFGFQCF